ncbi:MAG TPA: YciI family protein [Burkholderiaceae bacterium]|nr:YciI family protein [Burkholderiaceae bacterium]
MRFMIIRKADKQTEAEPTPLPSEALLAAMGKYNEQLVRAGAMLDGAGLRPSRQGARVKFSGGKPTVIDGPFAEAKELIAGYTLIQAKSREEAIEWVKRWPPLDGDGEVELEIRQLYELEDFGPCEAIDRMRELDERVAARK